MGMTLINLKGDDFRWNIFGWRKILALAHQYGWKPMGTLSPGDGDDNDPVWSGGYLSNDGQVITKEDAEALADALESALADLRSCSEAKDHAIARAEETGNHLINDRLVETMAGFFGQQCLEKSGSSEYFSKTPLEYFREYEQYVREFITFCRKGAFRIY